MTIQPQTLARRSNNGAAPSPDIARLKGVRFVIMPEPVKGLELDAALTKQFTGGDTCAGRFLFKNVIEFKPEFKVFINTNHLPRISDNTIFTSGRINVIPFERHFTPAEQDQGLKKEFCSPTHMSGILNWLIDGYRMFLEEGLSVPAKIHTATDEYRYDVTAEIDSFFSEILVPAADNRLKTSMLHQAHVAWAKENGLHPMTTQEFVGELRRRYEVKRDCIKGNVIIGFDLKK